MFGNISLIGCKRVFKLDNMIIFRDFNGLKFGIKKVGIVYYRIILEEIKLKLELY